MGDAGNSVFRKLPNNRLIRIPLKPMAQSSKSSS